MRHKKFKAILLNHHIQALTALFLFVVIAVSTCLRLSLFKSFAPKSFSSDKNIDECYDAGYRYVNVNADILYYTGYDYLDHDRVKGHYYYSLEDGKCTIYLISAKYIKASEQTPVTLENVSFKAALKKNDTYLKPLLEYMAIDLNWNYSGLSSHTCTIMISQYHYSMPLYLVLAVLTLAGIAAFVICLIKTFIYLKRR